MEMTHDLLDLICLYCDRDPVQDMGPQTDDKVSLSQNRKHSDYMIKEMRNIHILEV